MHGSVVIKTEIFLKLQAVKNYFPKKAYNNSYLKRIKNKHSIHNIYTHVYVDMVKAHSHWTRARLRRVPLLFAAQNAH